MVPCALQSSDQPIRDYALALALVSKDEAGWKIDSIQGTGCLLEGGRGLGVTAQHVAESLASGATAGTVAAAVFAPPTGGRVFRELLAYDRHPSEDVALFRIQDDDYFSPFTLSSEQHYGSAHYSLWGYPEDIQHDRMSEGGGLVPELVYSEGHIRRCVTYPLPINRVPGKWFYELSTPAGSCCSGAPVLERGSDVWRIIGIYVGELRNESGTLAVGYATQTTAIQKHWPALFTGKGDLSALCPVA